MYDASFHRSDAIVNAVLMLLGAMAVIDNVVVHWVLQWHRLNEGWDDGQNLLAEAALVVVGVVMFTIGLRRERRARRVI
jgi:uncharacterized membrane protein